VLILQFHKTFTLCRDQ